VVVPLRWDRLPHESDHVIREEGIQGGLVDARRPVPPDPYVDESASPELLGEDTLRQGTGHSPGPCTLVVCDLGGELTLNRQIGKRDPAT